MCGIASWYGPAPVIPETLRGAARRGPHSHGVAEWRQDSGWQIVSRNTGRLPVTTDRLERAIVHSRLATSTRSPGDGPPVDETMPFELDGWCLAHNGTVQAGSALAELARNQVDSWALLHYLVKARRQHSLEGAIERLAGELCSTTTSPHAAILGIPDGRIYVLRVSGTEHVTAHPVYLVKGEKWAAASSGPMPGVRLAPEGVALL